MVVSAPTFEEIGEKKPPAFEEIGRQPAFRGAGATGGWEEPGIIKSLLTSKEDPIKLVTQIPSQLVGGAEETVGALGSMAQWFSERASIGEIATKHIDVPGAGILSEYLVRKFGPKRPMRFYDKQMSLYAKQGEKWADFWEEQANKGWEAPDPEIMEARWRDIPVTKGLAVTARATPNYLLAIASSALTKNPYVGLAFISSVSGAGQYRRQRKAGAGIRKADTIASLTAAWEGITEKVPFDEVFKPAKSRFLKMLKIGSLESAQEFVQGIGENFLEYFGYKSKDLKSVPDAVKEGLKHAMDGWIENVVAGFGLGTMGGGIIPKRGITKPTFEEIPPTVGKIAPRKPVAPITKPEAVEVPVKAKIPKVAEYEAKPAEKVRASFSKYKKAMPNATEQEVVEALIEDGIRPPENMLKKYEDLPSAQRILEQDEIDRAVKRAAKAKPPTVAKAITDIERFGIKKLMGEAPLKGITEQEALNIIRAKPTEEENAVKQILKNRGIETEKVAVYPGDHATAVNRAVYEAMAQVEDVKRSLMPEYIKAVAKAEPTLEQRVDKAFKENDLDELVRLRNEAKGEFGNKLTMLISEVEYRNLDKLTMGQLRNKARYNNVPTNLNRAEMIRRIKEARKQPTKVEKKAFYTSTPEEWRTETDLYDWGKKGLRSKGNQKIGKRKTFIWQNEFEEVPVRLPKSTMDAFRARTDEIFKVHTRKGTDYYLIPKQVAKEVKAELGDDAFKQRSAPERSPLQKVNDTINSAKRRDLTDAEIGAIIEGYSETLGLTEKDLSANQKKYIEALNNDPEAKTIRQSFREGVEEAVQPTKEDIEERLGIQEQDIAEDVGDFLDGIEEAVPTYPKGTKFKLIKGLSRSEYPYENKIGTYIKTEDDLIGIRFEDGTERYLYPDQVQKVEARPTDLIGRPILTGGAAGKQLALGFYVDAVPPTDVPSKPTLHKAVAQALNEDYREVERSKRKYKGVKDEKALYSKYNFPNELFIHPDKPFPEMRAAWTIATKGKGLFGAPSKIGFPKGVEEIELPAEAIGKEPVSARQIIESLSKSLKVPYANMATHRRRAAAGFYEVRPIGIRQINVRDLNTAAHEAGHHIDYFWKVRRAGISKIGRKTWRMPEGTAKGTAAELTRLGKMLYGEKKPKGGYRAEGIAEFVRGYLTGHLDIKKEAPKFYKWFIEDYLPSNPEVAIGLNNARAMLTDYRLQGAEARIESHISTKEIKAAMRDRIRGGNLWMQTMFIDEFAPLRAALEEKKLRLAGVERLKQPLKPEEDPYELAVYYSQKEGARARQMVLFGTIDLWGNKTGKGLKEIMKPIADQNAVRPFTHWIVSARSLDLWKRGINPGISRADAQHVYDLYKDNVGWKETAQEITDWNGRVLDYLVQASALEPSIAKKMRELNPVYVPFLRVFAKGEKRFGGGGAGRGLITTKKGVFSIMGSGREIIDPFESMITQTRRMLSIAHKSVIARSLADLEIKHIGLADFIWKVPPPIKATTFRAEQAIEQLQKMGVEMYAEGLPRPGEIAMQKPALYDALMTVYGNSPIYLGKENIIAIVQNGKKSWYEVSPEMYRLLQGLDKFYLPRVLNITLGKPGRAVRLGATGINASFGLVRNPIRDSLDTIFKGKHARGPLASVQGVAKDLSRLGIAKSLGINPSKAAQEFVAQAGQISGFVGQDRKSLQHLRGEMLASSVGRYSIHTVKHPIDALREVFGVAESGPRIQEYEKALIVGEKKYGKGSPSAKIYAFNKAQDQTINYSRHGVIGKWLNQMTPFWNANAQDPSKVYRTFRTRGKEATAYAVAFLTLPALGLWWYNKDEEWYKELPAYETANYLHAKVPGKDVILRIPVPFLVGHIFQSTPVVMMDALYRADPKRIKEHFGHVLKGDVYPLAEWPAIVAPLIDVLQNKDWAGRPIVPRGVEGKLPSDQYKEYTTDFCKTIGKIFNQSPAKIEYMINAYSGGLYRRTGRIAGIITKAPEERQPADWPVIGAIVVRDPYAPKRSIERFYNEKEQLNRMYQSDKIEPESDLDRKRKRYNYISTKFLSPYWDKLQKTKSVAERKKIYQKIHDLIKKANKK